MTKEKIKIAASKGVAFKATKSLKDAMNPKPVEKTKKGGRKGAKAAASKKAKK